ncbi:MAG: nucleotidyltransferase family protein [bacterium]|nr:nucleotidyltransferase family protein [bacterium]
MQAIILAAGRGTRMTELTASVPKPMLLVSGRPLLEYKIDALPDSIDEVVLVVGYLQNVIREHFGASYGGRRIVYVEQKKELDGTAGALWSAQSVLHDQFLVMMGDDIYSSEDVAKCVAQNDTWALLVQELPELYRAGRVQLNAEGNIENIIESSKEDETRKEPGIASTNLFFIDARVFSCPLIPKHAGSLEFGLPQTLASASKQLNIPFVPIFTDKWIQITAPKDLVMAEKMLKER